VLARIHYLAFVNKSDTVPHHRSQSVPAILEGWLLADSNYHTGYRASSGGPTRWDHASRVTLDEMGYAYWSDIPPAQRESFTAKMREKLKTLEKEGWTPEVPSTQELVDHAVAAMENFKKASELAPEHGLYRLGYGCLLEQYVRFLEEREVVEMPSEFRAFMLLEAQKAYYDALCLSMVSHIKRGYRPIQEGLRSLAGYEAGQGYLRIAELYPSTDEEQKRRRSVVESNLLALENLPRRGPITPIVFSPDRVAGLSELLAQGSSVRFDLDGDGGIEKWRWVKPTTGILVWDPKKTGQVKSGRQLIGSVTWWLFFKDGYHVLDALDNNRDGNLTGGELKGLAVWFDRDSDAVSDPGEVVPIEKTPIASLATKSTSWEGRSPANPAGLTLNNGQVLPTYDWVTEPIVGIKYQAGDRRSPGE